MVISGPVKPPARTFSRGDETELAEAFLQDFAPSGKLGSAEGDFWRYDDRTGLWEKVPDNVAAAFIARYAGCPVVTPRPRCLTVSHRNIMGALAVARSLLEADSGSLAFASASPGIAFADVYVEVATTILTQPHSPDHLARHGFSFDYAPAATAPQFQRFLAEIFPEKDGPERIRLIQEFIGTCLIGQATRYQRCLILHGAGRNGKSAMLEIVTAIFPASGVCALPPQQFGERFRAVVLAGKSLNVVHELPETEIVASSHFKSIITGDPITGEQKHRDPFTFCPSAGHILSVNTLPPVNDHTEGFWRRTLVIPFAQKFVQGVNADPDIASDIIRTELPGIVTWALRGALRVKNQGTYSPCRASDEWRRKWRIEANPVATFLENECAVTDEPRTPTSHLYAAFREWARSNGFRDVNIKTFTNRAKAHGIVQKTRNTGSHLAARLRSPSDRCGILRVPEPTPKPPVPSPASRPQVSRKKRQPYI